MPGINIKGLYMHYELFGQGVPLVLIAGLGTDHTALKEIAEQTFANAGYQCLVFDNRDVGKTNESPAPYTIRQFAEDTLGLMDGLGIGRAHILGISMGGAIAQEMAINHSKRVRTLTLVCAVPRVGPESRSFVEAWKIMRRQLTPEQFLWAMSPMLFTYRFMQNEEAVQAALQGARDNPPSQSVAAFERQCEAILTHDTLDRLGSIATPTHVVVGREDVLTQPAASHTMADRIPGARLTIIPEAGHALWSEKPAETNKAVLDFLQAQ